jgi:hypothetical protein
MVVILPTREPRYAKDNYFQDSFQGHRMTVANVDLLCGQRAQAVLNDYRFLTLWRTLYDKCPHSTAFQTPNFVRSWYGAYSTQWQPVLIQSQDSKGDLIGLWLLAYNPTTNVLAHAGTHQAENHTWLSLRTSRFFRRHGPNSSDSFPLRRCASNIYPLLRLATCYKLH